jgi:hypothetical protein
VSRADAGAAPGSGLHHGAEIVAAQRASLFQVGADRGEVVRGQHFAQQLSVRVGACFGWGPQRGVSGVWWEPSQRAQSSVAWGAGPGVAGWITCHARSDRIEVDVAVATQDRGFRVDQAGFVSSFPQGIRAAVPCIELADLAASELLHHLGDGAGCTRPHQQVHVVVHEHIGVQRARGIEQRFAEQVQITVRSVSSRKQGSRAAGYCHAARCAGECPGDRIGVAGHPERMAPGAVA